MPDNPYLTPSQQSSEVEPQPRVYRDAEDALLDNNTAVRVLGAIAITSGLLLGYFNVYAPLVDAIAQENTIYMHSHAFGASLICIVCGSIMVVAGRHTRKILLDRWYHATPVNVTVTLLLVVFAIAAEILFEKFVASLGYVFR